MSKLRNLTEFEGYYHPGTICIHISSQNVSMVQYGAHIKNKIGSVRGKVPGTVHSTQMAPRGGAGHWRIIMYVFAGYA